MSVTFKVILVILIATLLTAGATILVNSDASEIEEESSIQLDHNSSALHLGFWKVSHIEASFKDHLDDAGIADYNDHIKLMTENGYIEFTSDSTFNGNNGLLDLSGTYEITKKKLLTKNHFGFQHNYRIQELTSSSFVMISDQEDLTLTIFYVRKKE